MPLDRVQTLRNAEKLLRQGKLDAAIVEYLRVVEDQPKDWNTANILGDLYVRARQIDKAVEQFIRIADHLNDEGFLPKAGALYKKILKLKPDHEHALIQGAEIAASQGLLADARSYLNSVAERRRTRGDKRGAAQMAIRLGSLDAADFEARVAGASARVDVGDTAGAVSDLKSIAAELTQKGRPADALEALRRAALLDADDEEIREQLLNVYIGTDDFARARECASTVEHFKALAAAFESKGFVDEALDALCAAARLNPSLGELRAQLAQALVARGNLTAAAEYLTEETAGSDPQLLMTVVEIQLRGDKIDEGVALLSRLLAEHPTRREDIAVLGWNLADRAPEAGFRVVELAADSAVAQSDWASAAAALQEYVTRVPNHIPALMRLVEICVDGGLEATMYSAQGQLADAYIAAGAAAEARFIAEDLVAREPWERSNIERFRRALVLLGEPDPDGLIAERLSGQVPFTSTDLLGAEDFSTPEPAGATQTPSLPEPSEHVAPQPAPPSRGAPAPPAPKRSKREETTHFELSANAIDIDSVLGGLESPPAKPAPKPTAHATQESVEVDLSIVLEDIKPHSAGAPTPARGGTEPLPPLQGSDIDGVFEQLRGEAARRSPGDAAEEQINHGLALRQAGKFDESIQALQIASRSPRHRFQAAALIGRIYRERDMLTQAIEWFERAAQAPSPTADHTHALLYELADALESAGEVARALAIFLELQADAGDYRDVAARADRLAKVQTEG